MNKEQLIADIKAMSVLELSELVKALEEEFGVSAAAAVVAAPAAGGAAAAAGDAEQTDYNAVLTEIGPEKIKVIKIVKDLTGLGLKEAKELVDGAPKAVKEGIQKEEFDKIVAAFAEVGAKIEHK